MPGRFLRNPLETLFGRRRRTGYLESYVVREYARGRSLEEIMRDPYVRNRATEADRARLLDSPEVVAALGDQAAEDLRLTATAFR